MGFFSEDMVPMLGVFEAETSELMSTLDAIASRVEQERAFSPEDVAELFRCAHTTKGSSAMMGLDSLSHLTHKVEDLFDLMRSNPEIGEGHVDDILDHLYAFSDFVKDELAVMSEDDYTPTNAEELIGAISSYVATLSGSGETGENSEDSENSEDRGDPEGRQSAEVAGNRAGGEREFDFSNTGVAAGSVAGTGGVNSSGVGGNEKASENVSESGGNASGVSSSSSGKTAEASAGETEAASSPGIALKVNFKPDVPMVNARALVILKQLGGQVRVQSHVPSDLSSADSAHSIAENGLVIVVDSNDVEATKHFLAKNSFISRITELDEMAQNRREASEHDRSAADDQAVEDKFISLRWSSVRALQDMAGEFLLHTARLKALCTSNPDETELRSAVSKAARLVDDLVYQIDKMAMVRMSAMVPQLSRMVRDMCRNSGKQVSFEVQGGNIEIDRNLYNSISDPLLHIIRNAVDHGIETPEERLAAGKEARGKVTLSVENLGARVAFRVSDDGRGVDTEKVLAEAERKGALKKPAEEYTRQEILNMVMIAGLSTSNEVTQYSGRGVGMDVVSAVIRDFNGRVEIDSKLAEGTAITLYMPITVASVESLGFHIGTITYHMPLYNLNKIYTANEAADLISSFEGTSLFTYKKREIPVIDMHKLLNCPGTDAFYIVCHSLDEEFVIGVDDIVGDISCANKPLPSCFNSTWQASCPIRNVAIMDDGSIGYALNAALLSSLAQGRENSFWEEVHYDDPSSATHEIALSTEIPPWALLFKLGEDWCAISIEHVSRIIPLASYAETPKGLPYLLGLINYHNRAIALFDLAASAGVEAESGFALVMEDERGECEAFTITSAIGVRNLSDAVLAEDQPAARAFAAGWHTSIAFVDDPKEPPITLLLRD